ncbi:NAD-dependent epimerase/dehydratase family protein [Natronospirillum operosum]|uniref:NAD-dependent epimerase/dehydratase family protein n=1 Tax=Natronospirillum operosum TaxID=2759953 RepID=A0A4Z0WJX6_9GAMM|nr:NAD(P)H-binding protein [Natronospirillum operosum]TGG95475.1 NAD-dependent epimerase/dehydratase family protein [Natronospirillum operosum]
MKIAVIGSTSATGLHLVAKGVRRGHEITAFSRRPQKLAGIQGLANVVAGNGLDASDVSKAIAGQDAVIAIVGSNPKSRTKEATEVIRNVISEMRTEDVRRLLFVSSYLLEATRPRIMMPVIRWWLRDSLEDLKSAEELITTSQMKWTVIRPTELNDKPETNKVRLERNSHFSSGPYEISRRDLANVILDELEQEKYIGTRVMVSWS